MVCLTHTPERCRRALDQAHAQGQTLPALTRFWLDVLLTEPKLDVIALRELAPDAEIIPPRSHAAERLGEACLGRDSASCAHIARIAHDAQRTFWRAMACRAHNTAACLQMDLDTLLRSHDSGGTCTLSHRAPCWAEALNNATHIQANHARCQADDEAACWNMLTYRLGDPMADNRRLQHAERACACHNLPNLSQRAKHNTTCRNVQTTRAKTDALARARNALTDCAEGDTRACVTAADTLATPSHPALFSPEADAELARALRERACQRDPRDGRACWALQRYDDARPALEGSCEAGDAAACALLGDALVQSDSDPTRGRALLKAACAAHDYASCRRYALAVYQPADTHAAARLRALKRLPIDAQACDSSTARPDACLTIALALRDGLGPIAPDAAAAQPFFKRACAQGSLSHDACAEVALSERPDALAAACKAGAPARCLELGALLDDTSRTRAKRAYEAACHLGSVAGCRAAALPLHHVCLNTNAPHQRWACLAACAEGDALGCAGVEHYTLPALNSGAPVYILIPSPDDAYANALAARSLEGRTDKLKRTSAMFEAACARGHLGSCYGQAALIRRGSLDPDVIQTHRARSDRERARIERAIDRDHGAVLRRAPARPAVTAPPHGRAAIARAERTARALERDARARAETSCAKGDARACAELDDRTEGADDTKPTWLERSCALGHSASCKRTASPAGCIDALRGF